MLVLRILFSLDVFITVKVKALSGIKQRDRCQQRCEKTFKISDASVSRSSGKPIGIIDKYRPDPPRTLRSQKQDMIETYP